MERYDLQMSETEMNQNAQEFAEGLKDRGYQMDNTYQAANAGWIEALQNNEADAINDAMAFANRLPDKK